MTALPPAAEALTSAFGRFDRANAHLVEAATGVGQADVGAAMVGAMTSRIAAIAAIQSVRFSDDVWKALLELQHKARR